LKRKLKEEEDQIQLFDRKIEKVEEEGRFLERGYISTHNKLLEKQLKLAEINAENNVLHNRIERFRVLSQSLMSGE
jgi:septal ring factor EnvC (AmiA/AmiB activator)